MDKEIFVQNIKKFCFAKGVKPTVACRESGAGPNLINQIERRGSMPSVEKVHLLSSYLGITTSELLGEVSPAAGGALLPPGELDLLSAYRAADGRARDMVHLALEPWMRAGKKDTAM